MRKSFGKIFLRVSLVLLGVTPLIVWLLLDAGLPFLVISKFGPDHDKWNEMAVQSGETKYVRLAILAGCLATWLAATGIDAAIVLRSKQSDSGSIFTVVAFHVVMIATVLACYGPLTRAGAYHRAQRLAGRINTAADQLFDSWPRQAAEVDGLGRVIPVPLASDRLYVNAAPGLDAFQDDVGYTIERSPSGNAILFLMTSVDFPSGQFHGIVCERNGQHPDDVDWRLDTFTDWNNRRPIAEGLTFVVVRPSATSD